MKKKYPLIKGKMVYPHKNLNKCPVCGNKLSGNFLAFGVGALLGDKDTRSMDKKMFGFATMHVHFDRDDYYQLEDLIEDAPNGQAEIYTCSFRCMKKLINDFIDEAEKNYNDKMMIEKAKKY